MYVYMYIFCTPLTHFIILISASIIDLIAKKLFIIIFILQIHLKK